MTPSQKKLERNFWRNGLKPRLEAIPGMFYDRIETGSTASSVPDVAYTYNGHHGWIELKAVESKDGSVDLSHYTPGQRRWLFNRGEAAGYCWLMIRVDSMVYVVHWSNVRNIPTGAMTIKALKEQSLFVWSGGVSTKDIKAHF
mgnify:CR=1 FL=1